MVTIPETTATLGFVNPVQFDRTDAIKERVVDCTREELIDLVFMQLGMLERFQGVMEGMNAELEDFLGYNEPMFLPKK